MFLVPRVLVLITSQSNVSGNPRKMHVHCIHVENAAASATKYDAVSPSVSSVSVCGGGGSGGGETSKPNSDYRMKRMKPWQCFAL